MNREVTMELLEKYGKEFVQDRANRVAQNAVVGKGVNAAATDSGVEREIANTFSISLEQGKITNQKKSGRCWMFAALNCMRFQVMKHCNLETFELSQNYTLFYDKLEKSNYFLNTIQPVDRTFAFRTVKRRRTVGYALCNRRQIRTGSEGSDAGKRNFLQHKRNGILHDRKAAGVRMHSAGSIPCRQHQRRAACKEGRNDADCLQHALHLPWQSAQDL